MKDFIGLQIMIKIKKLLKENKEFRYGKALFYMPYLESYSFNNLLDCPLLNDIQENDYVMVIEKLLENTLFFGITSNKLDYKVNQEVTLVHEKQYVQIPGKIIYIFSLKDYEEDQTKLEIQHDLENLGIDINQELLVKKIV